MFSCSSLLKGYANASMLAIGFDVRSRTVCQVLFPDRQKRICSFQERNEQIWIHWFGGGVNVDWALKYLLTIFISILRKIIQIILSTDKHSLEVFMSSADTKTGQWKQTSWTEIPSWAHSCIKRLTNRTRLCTGLWTRWRNFWHATASMTKFWYVRWSMGEPLQERLFSCIINFEWLQFECLPSPNPKLGSVRITDSGTTAGFTSWFWPGTPMLIT